MTSMKDPVDWTVDEVVRFVCHEPADEWSRNLARPDLQALEIALRENLISGSAFLKLTYPMVKDLGISIIAYCQYVLAASESLQRRSLELRLAQQQRRLETPAASANPTALLDELSWDLVPKETTRRVETTLVTQPLEPSLPEARPLEEQLGSKPAFGQEDFFDRLLRSYPPEDDNLVPVLGESDSEDYYDSELEEDEVRGPPETHDPSTSGHPESPEKLTINDVNAVIDAYIAEHETYFTTTRLPREEYMAFALWTLGQKRPETTDVFLKRYAHLEKRLLELRKALCVAEHSCRSSLQKACACLDQTLSEMCLNRWQVSILKKVDPPPKIARPPRIPRVAKVKETSDGEETLSSDFDSDRDSDFIDPSEDGLEDEDEEDVVMAMDSESEQSDGNHLEGMYETMAMDSESEQSDGNRLEGMHEIPKDGVPEEESNLRPDLLHGPFRETSSPAEDVSHLYFEDEVHNHSPPAAKRRRLEAETPAADPATTKEPESRLTLTGVRDSETEYALTALTAANSLTWEDVERSGNLAYLVAKALSCERKQEALRLFDFLEKFIDLLFEEFTREVLQAMSGDRQALDGWEADDARSVILMRVNTALALLEDEHDEFTPFFQCLKGLAQGYRLWASSSSQAQLLEEEAAVQPIEEEGDVQQDEETAVQPDEGEAVHQPNKEATSWHPSSKRKRATNRNFTLVQREAQQRQELQEEAKKALQGLQLSHRDVNSESTRHPVTFEDPVIYLDPHIGDRVKPHQLHGIQFLFREIVQNERPEGISLLVTISAAGASPNPAIRDQIPEEMRQCKALVLCPASLIVNWCNEFEIWAPPHHNLGKIRPILPKTSAWATLDRTEDINACNNEGGVLIISYDIFRKIVGTTPEIIKNSGRELAMQNVQNWLLNGPTLVIADEAQTLRNSSSLIAGAASRIRTHRRIALTGTPLSNGLKDYYAMLDWVAPGYLGTRSHFGDRFIEPIENGSYIDSTKSERRLALRRQELLLRIISPKVDRADMSVLATDLPPKYEFSFYFELTKTQKDLYDLFVKVVQSEASVSVRTRLWSWLNLLELCCVHPAVFRAQLDRRETQGTGDDHIQSPGLAPQNRPDLDMPTAQNVLPLSSSFEMQAWLGTVPDLLSPNLSSRVIILGEIVRQAIALGDKVLVFSSSIPTLDYLERFMGQMGWKSFRVDGKVPAVQRSGMIESFNKDTTSHVFLLSTHAAGIGLNIVGANRVVIFDFSFNPTWEEQAVGRAYRIGQNKKVYVYRLVSGGTVEEKIYGTSIFKKQLACRVVDRKNVAREGTASGLQYLVPWQPSQRRGGIEPQAHACDPEMMKALMGSECADYILKVRLSWDEIDPDDLLTAEDNQVVEREWCERMGLPPPS
ncbi:SNF2 family helicase/ATPase [Penicillium bovifimosum]|uniref:SNF2 family helicase/ATPase n=1 Tax=Penicillium bovifimosum TaxID=126998 RepID=A0A9W9HFM3_9EURO|nr:SNF2 family helicase/ATPase [Penicillium bovifimosum]KAJ5146286.1 SNF2 family helicase/ATPase [Penicillium bovifimosum]